MWSIIFALALNSVAEHHGSFSGILCTAIVGGAIAPLVVGWLGDRVGLRYAMLVPLPAARVHPEHRLLVAAAGRTTRRSRIARNHRRSDAAKAAGSRPRPRRTNFDAGARGGHPPEQGRGRGDQGPAGAAARCSRRPSARFLPRRRPPHGRRRKDKGPCQRRAPPRVAPGCVQPAVHPPPAPRRPVIEPLDAGALPVATHDGEGDARQAATVAGAARPRDPRWRPGRDL